MLHMMEATGEQSEVWLWKAAKRKQGPVFCIVPCVGGDWGVATRRCSVSWQQEQGDPLSCVVQMPPSDSRKASKCTYLGQLMQPVWAHPCFPAYELGSPLATRHQVLFKSHTPSSVPFPMAK